MTGVGCRELVTELDGGSYESAVLCWQFCDGSWVSAVLGVAVGSWVGFGSWGRELGAESWFGCWELDGGSPLLDT